MSLIIRLRESIGFTPNEIEVSRYIVENTEKILKMSSTELANKTFTSAATITRLCKKIGVESFQNFKIQLATEINYFQINSIEIYKNNEINKNDSLSDVMNKIISLSIDSLKETYILLTEKILKDSINMIQKSKILDFYGVGASHLVALDANYKFMRIGKITSCYTLYDQQYIQAKNSNKNHLAIIFSYSGETKEIIDLAKILVENGSKIIVVTKNKNNTLQKYANVKLYVTSRESLYRSAAIYSRISMLNIVDILYSAYANLNYDSLYETLGKTRIPK